MRGTSSKVLAVLGVAVLATAGSVLAQSGHEGEHPGHGSKQRHARHHEGPGPLGPIVEMLQSLDLTPEQREQIHTAVEKRMDAGLGAALEAERDARQSVRKLIHDPAATDDQIVEAVRAGTAEEERLALEHRRLFEELQGVLTDQQKQELRQRLEQMPEPRMRRGRPSSGG